MFKLNTTLAAYFGAQLFVARPELKGYWCDNNNFPTNASGLYLKALSEDELVSIKPFQIAQLFESSEGVVPW